jgi:hypothetical protein
VTWIIRYPHAKGCPSRAVGPFPTRDSAITWHDSTGSQRRPEYLELDAPGPEPVPLPKIPNYVGLKHGGLPHFTQANEIKALLDDYDSKWFIVGEEHAVRPGEPVLVEHFGKQDNVWMHVERVVARRTVVHRTSVDDVYGITVRYVLATFTDRYPHDRRDRP